MRHAKHQYSLNKSFSLRKALVISMAKNLLKYQRIKTTRNRAKATSQVVEKLITMAKVATLAKKRAAYQVLGDHKLVSLLFNDIAPRFKDRQSGFTRILNLGNRRGDDAKIVVFELTQIKEEKKKVKAEKEAKTPATPAESKTESAKEKPAVEQKPRTEAAVAEKITEKHPVQKKPPKKFLGGIRNIFKKERDSL
jgi:large subunit ribosomal protein L17